MHLNLGDPDSILRWWRAHPERHWAYLDFFEARSPRFRGSIRAARARIQADPLFSPDRQQAFEAALAQASLEAQAQAQAAAAWDDEADAAAPAEATDRLH